MRIYLIVLFLLLSLFSKAQYIYTGGCVDSALILPPASFYCPGSIPPNFSPVCGCDGNTYRNACFAQNLGGVTTYQPGICGDFDIDLAPDIIVPGGPSVWLSIYVNTTQSAIIWVFDEYGRTGFEQVVQVYPPASSYNIYEIDLVPYLTVLQPGVYYLFVIINGETQHTKLVIAAEE